MSGNGDERNEKPDSDAVPALEWQRWSLACAWAWNVCEGFPKQGDDAVGHGAHAVDGRH